MDPYLSALMHGEVSSKKSIEKPKQAKNRFEIQIEKEIDAYLDTLEDEEKDSLQNQLVPPAMKRARLRTKLREEAQLSELSGFITTAIKILTSKGKNYLDADQAELLQHDLDQAESYLDEIDLNLSTDKNLRELLHISDGTVESIFKIAQEYYNASSFPESLALFIFLATLIPENADYWYRSGILAQQRNHFDLAIRLHQAALTLDPSLIGPRIFSIDCYLNSGKQQEAEAVYKEAKSICETSPVEDFWKDLLSKQEAILKINLKR